MKKFAATILKALMRLLGSLPLGFHYAFAGFLKWLAKDVLRYRRDVVMTNLARSFPDRKYDEISEIADKFYAFFADMVVEIIWYGGCRKPERFLKKKPLVLTGVAELRRYFEESPSVILLNSHCGNLEYFGGAHCVECDDGLPSPFNERNAAVVYKRPTNAVWDEVFADNRKALVSDRANYDGYVESFDFLRYTLKNLSEGRKVMYNVNADQSPYSRRDQVFVGDFMHQPTYAMLGGITLAHKKGLAVMYMNISVESRGHYRMNFIPVCKDASQMDPKDILRQYYNLLQKDIEAQPWNYLWTHKRWKI